jgi:hypothetical protein
MAIMFMQKALVVTVASAAHVLVLIVMLPGLTIAHQDRHAGVSAMYRAGENNGNTSHENGDPAPTYEDCIATNQAIYGFNTAEYCNGFLTGFYDGVINR